MNIKVFIFKNLLFPKCWDSAVVRQIEYEWKKKLEFQVLINVLDRF